MEKKMLNVGIIGLGVGEQHLIGFKKLKAIKINFCAVSPIEASCKIWILKLPVREYR